MIYTIKSKGRDFSFEGKIFHKNEKGIFVYQDEYINGLTREYDKKDVGFGVIVPLPGFFDFKNKDLTKVYNSTEVFMFDKKTNLYVLKKRKYVSISKSKRDEDISYVDKKVLLVAENKDFFQVIIEKVIGPGYRTLILPKRDYSFSDFIN